MKFDIIVYEVSPVSDTSFLKKFGHLEDAEKYALELYRKGFKYVSITKYVNGEYIRTYSASREGF